MKRACGCLFGLAGMAASALAQPSQAIAEQPPEIGAFPVLDGKPMGSHPACLAQLRAAHLQDLADVEDLKARGTYLSVVLETDGTLEWGHDQARYYRQLWTSMRGIDQARGLEITQANVSKRYLSCDKNVLYRHIPYPSPPPQPIYRKLEPDGAAEPSY